MYQDIKNFKIPNNFRGKSKIYIQLWWIIDLLLFRTSPQFLYPFRVFLLRIFGAKVGIGVKIRPSVFVTYPWKISVGNYVWIGDDAVLYSLGTIEIGDNTVISQKSYICSADHNYNDPLFSIHSKPIIIGSEVWISTDVFVGPGVTIGNGTVIGARSSVFKDMPSGYICYGNPCTRVRLRLSINEKLTK